jgi:hypothetical protein
MGQYYKPTILAKNKKTVVSFVYSHDYSNGLKLMEHSYLKNNFVSAFETLLIGNPQSVVWAGDYAKPEKGYKNNVFNRGIDKLQIKPVSKLTSKHRYIVNHTKKSFVDKTQVVNNDGWQIHPLPLLTCEGNGEGGGDFFGLDPKKLVGSWSRDVISIETKKPKEFTELIFDLKE